MNWLDRVKKFEGTGMKETREAPVAEGELYDVVIQDRGRKGDGLAKVKGFVIFVPDAQVDEKVRVRVNRIRGNVGFAEKVE
ncbi:MAG: TRAM domain-containing protein [Candidatus Hydrothermarchaeaceae archaeon]